MNKNIKRFAFALFATTLVFTSQAQFGNLLKKKDKGNSGSSASGGIQQLMEDEPGNIFGNYYIHAVNPGIAIADTENAMLYK
jgi:hypothetical protein